MKKLLLSSSLILAGLFSYSQCSELFFSEYVEGSGNNKALEVYNPTDVSVDLSNYIIKRYSNGSGSATETMALSGTINANDVTVITNGQTDSVWVSSGGYWSLPVDPALHALGDLHDGEYPAVHYFNGDDAITLEKLDGTIVDIFGKITEDPGSAWTDDISASYTDANGGTWWTRDQSLIRKYSVQEGVSTNPVFYNVTIEWDSLPRDNWSNIGFHSCDCHPFSVEEIQKADQLLLFPNPTSNGNVVIKSTGIMDVVEVHNLLGEQLLSQKLAQPFGEYRLNVEGWQKGIYIVSAKTPNGLAVQKLTIR